MRGYIIVLRALMRMTFRKGAGGRDRSLGTLIGMLITAGIMSACVAVVAGIFGGKINEFGLATEVTALLLAADFMLTLIFGIVSVMSSLYFSRDGEFLASLPVRSNAVMAAKVSVIYVQEAAVGGLFVLPAAITLGVAASATAAFYVMTVIAVVFVPVAALLFAALVSVPLVYVAGFFRRRGAVAAVLLLVLFAMLMTAYLVVTNLVPAVSVPSDGGDAVGAAISALIGGVRRGMYVIYPVYCLARFGSGETGCCPIRPRRLPSISVYLSARSLCWRRYCFLFPRCFTDVRFCGRRKTPPHRVASERIIRCPACSERLCARSSAC